MSVHHDPKKIVRYGRQLMEQDEAEADVEIHTGALVQAVAGSGEYGDDHTVALVDTDGANVSSVRVALDFRGRGMEQGDSYEAGEVVQYVNTAPGVGLFLRLAAGETVSLGDGLVPTTGGEVRAAAGDGTETDLIIAEAGEDLDNSGSTEVAYVRSDR
jgi:hypothetical protein